MENYKNKLKLIIPKGCDNAPRKQTIIEFTEALLKQDKEIITRYAHESIVLYQLQENKKVEGLHSFVTALQDENSDLIDTLEIYQVITHGKFASINGVLSLENNTKIDFYDVYTFSSAAKSGKVKEIKSYRLPPLD